VKTLFGIPAFFVFSPFRGFVITPRGCEFPGLPMRCGTPQHQPAGCPKINRENEKHPNKITPNATRPCKPPGRRDGQRPYGKQAGQEIPGWGQAEPSSQVVIGQKG
jgi:hypothetical protein